MNAAATTTTSKRILTAFLLVLAIAAPAFALTAGDVLNKMSPKEQAAYVDGAIETAMWLAATRDNNRPKADCIMAWYYGNSDRGARSVLATFEKAQDKPAAALINALIERECGR